MKRESTYIQYGVPSDWAAQYDSIGLPASTFNATSQKLLISNYAIPKDQVVFVKRCLKRQPIEEDILQTLLEKSRFVCCLCRGQKGTGYIIHHINPYATSQDNDYENLAVLCLTDHDLVHREGQNLTMKITKEMVKKAKRSWEKTVELNDIKQAAQNFEISEVDFINAPRIVELYKKTFNSSPLTAQSSVLKQLKALNSDGNINRGFTSKIANNPNTPFIFFGPAGSYALSMHYEEAFKKLLSQIDFIDLDTVLNKTSLKRNDLKNRFCFYDGGVYSKKPDLPVSEQTDLTHLYFHRAQFFVEWLVDPHYMVSTSSIGRLGSKGEYLIYGRIRNIGEKDWKGKTYIHLDIRPYIFGSPVKTKDRKPIIHYIEKYRDYNEDDDKDLPF